MFDWFPRGMLSCKEELNIYVYIYVCIIHICHIPCICKNVLLRVWSFKNRDSGVFKREKALRQALVLAMARSVQLRLAAYGTAAAG